MVARGALPVRADARRGERLTGEPQSRTSTRGKQAITAGTALLLGAFFGTTPQFWLRLQEGYDLALARTETPISTIRPLST